MRFLRTRWILAAVCLMASIWLMRAAFKMAGMGAAGPVILSMVSFVTVVLLIAPETAYWLAEQIAKPFANLFYPSDSFKKPPLSYTLARRYRKELRFEDAVAQYQNIIEFHPQERQAYLELIEAAGRLGDTDLVEKYTALLHRRFPESAENVPPPDPGV